MRQDYKLSSWFGVLKLMSAATCVGLLVFLSACHNTPLENNGDEFKDRIALPPLDTTAWSKHDSIKWAGNDPAKWPASFDFGSTASIKDIKSIDIDISPDGCGLPPGTGLIHKGREIYDIKCAACHGSTGKDGPNGKLVGIIGDTSVRDKTIGNYWPYATTIFDYIRRAMPFNAPGSLTNEEVYHLTAFLLYENKIIDSSTRINAQNLARIKMPAQKYYVNDDRHGGAEIR